MALVQIAYMPRSTLCRSVKRRRPDGRTGERHRSELRIGQGAVPRPRPPAERLSRPRGAASWAMPQPRGGSGAARSAMGSTIHWILRSAPRPKGS